MGFVAREDAARSFDSGSDAQLTDAPAPDADSGPIKLALAGPGTLKAGACSKAYTITSRDGAGKLAAAPGDTIVTPTQGGAATFFGDSTCTAKLTAVTINAGASQGSFWLKNTKAGVRPLTVKDGAGALSAAVLSVTIAATAPDAKNSDITGTGPVVANMVATSTVTIMLRDAFDNPVAGVVPTFSAGGKGNIYGGCSATGAKGGEATCSLASASAGKKQLQIETPIKDAGGDVTFDGIAVSDCTTLKQKYGLYLLTKDLPKASITADCINIQADNVTLDCQGYAIAHDTLDAALIRSQKSFSTIRNCKVTAGSSSAALGAGILLQGSDGLVEKNKIMNSFWGISIIGNRNTVKHNHVEGNAKGIHLTGHDNAALNNLVKNNNKHQGWGLAIWKGHRNKLTNNKVYGGTFTLVLNDADNAVITKCGVMSGTSYEYPGTTTGITYPACPTPDCVWTGDKCI